MPPFFFIKFANMLYVNQNTSSRVVVQAQELSVNGLFLWRLWNKETQTEILEYIVPTTVTERFSEYHLTLNIPIGDGWTYEIYDGNGMDLDYISMPILEVGKLVVLPELIQS